MKDFRSLKVWRKSHELVLEVYCLSREFPAEERFGLTSQLRRSAASIPANIAEGCGRGSDPDLARFLQIAMGSASETEYHIILAGDLRYLDPEAVSKLLETTREAKRMLASFLQKLKADR